MRHLFATIVWGVAAFSSTDLDDLLLLSTLFMDVEFSRRSIISGEFIGMSALVFGSVGAALLALPVPTEWLALLGLAPLLLGIRRSWNWWSECHAGHRFSNIEFVVPGQLPCRHSPYAVWTVIILTIANGGDNLSVYIPLFATERAWIAIYVVVFTFLTGIWCLLGYSLTHHPMLRERVKRYGDIVIPAVLIGIGLKVLAGTHSLWH